MDFESYHALNEALQLIGETTSYIFGFGILIAGILLLWISIKVSKRAVDKS